MADDPVEAIRRVYDEWGRGNWRPKWDIYAEDMEWGWSDDFPAWPACTTTRRSGTSGCASG